MSSKLQRGLLTRLLTAKSPEQIEAERRKLEADQEVSEEHSRLVPPGDLTLAERLRLEREQAQTLELRDSSLSSPKTNSSSPEITRSNENVEYISLPESGSLPEYAPPQSGRLPQTRDLGYRSGSLPESGRLPESNRLSYTNEASIDLLASLPQVKGFTKLYNQLTDYLYPQLDPAEQAVHLQLFRLSWGNSKPSCIIGLPRLAERSGMKKTAAQDAVNRLVKKGLIKKLRMVIGKGQAQGIEYYVLPTSSMPNSGSLPDNDRLPDNTTIKEKNNLKENTHTEQRTAADLEKPIVGVGSKFTLEECKRYAEHLRSTGQGINNPGGYGTTIHRTGEVDVLIERFLNPEIASTSSNLDTSQCPDCHGTGMYYPEGLGKGGVKKCQHERLPQQS